MKTETNKQKKTERNIQGLWDNHRGYTKCIMRKPEGGKRKEQKKT